MAESTNTNKSTETTKFTKTTPKPAKAKPNPKPAKAKPTPKPKKPKKVDPAKRSFFFGPGWEELGKFISAFWNYNMDDIRAKSKNMREGKGMFSFKGAASLMSCISLILFGTFFFCVITGIISVVLGVFFLLVYCLIFLIWGTDRLYLLRNKIFVPCPVCKTPALIPTYLCPKCGAEHNMLYPGVYGAFFHYCNCGQKMPSHVFTGRKKLKALCSNPVCKHALNGTESIPLCIPIVGGRSAGKTAFITAFSYDFIEKVAPRNDLSITHYSDASKKFYETEITQDYLHGTTRMTQTEMNRNVESSKAFHFMVSSKKLNPPRLVQIYDVAGESFVDNTENEMQLHYKYCHGVVFMLDPLSIPNVQFFLEGSGINEIDKRSVGTLDVDLVLDAFMNKLREITGQAPSSVFQVPIAVVISKCDIRMLEQFIGEDLIAEYMSERNMDIKDYSVAEDAICRKFLFENGLAGFVSNIDMRFKNNRYFKCSAIGHTRENGRYNPKGVLDPLEWIFQLADGGMKSTWHDNDFDPVQRDKN